MIKTFQALTVLALAAVTFGPAQAATFKSRAACACPPGSVHRVLYRASRRRDSGRAYAQSFYGYRSASRVRFYYRAPWVEAPHDGHVAPRYHNGGYYQSGGYERRGYDRQGYEYNPGLDRGFSGGVGYNTEGEGGGYGGAAIIAGGQNMNGPTYNSYGQSFSYGGAATAAARTNFNWRNASIPLKTK